MPTTVKIIENNKNLILGELDEAIDRALEAMGLQAEAYVKAACTAVDTGLLRNSITYALHGQGAATSSYKADNPKKGTPSSGSYSGTAPNEPHTVFIGTNVEYAPYVEYGHALPGGGHVAGIHFLERGITGHMNVYKTLAEAALKGFQ